MEFRLEQRENSARMLPPPLSFRSPDSFSLSRVFEPFEFKPRSYLLRASYLVISIMVGAFLSQPCLHSFRPLARTRSSTWAERRRNDPNSSLIVPLNWTLSSRQQSVHINCRLLFKLCNYYTLKVDLEKCTFYKERILKDGRKSRLRLKINVNVVSLRIKDLYLRKNGTSAVEGTIERYCK